MTTRPLLLALAVAAAAALSSPTHAAQTPYNNTPVAVVANDGNFWDDQIAAVISAAQVLNGKTGQMIVVIDFCHSGGFIDNLSGAGRYIATASDWFQLSFSGADLTVGPVLGGSDGAFGQTFMNSSLTKTLHNSFLDAVPQVPFQTPQEFTGANAPTSLAFNAGDRAIIFSAGDKTQQGSFFTDVSVAYNGLINRANNPWPANNVTTLWDQGQTTGQFGGAFIKGASTITNLSNAIINAYADPGFTNNSKLFLYMNDHGTSSDVIKSKVTGPAGARIYSYQANVGTSEDLQAPDPGSPGIWWISIRTKDTNAAHYSNWVDPLPSWQHAVDPAGFINFFGDPANIITWLDQGTDYNFGFTNTSEAYRSDWFTFLNTKNADPNSYDISDLGRDGPTAWGTGGFIYNQAGTLIPDPSQWPGWDNGGDGFVYSPVPEPASLGILAAGLMTFMVRRRRT